MFEPLNDLERLLMAAARDPAQRTSFTDALMTAELYIVPTAPPDAQGKLQGVRAATTPDGASAAAIFTAPERATAAYGADVALLANTGRIWIEWLRPGPVFLNPGQDYRVVWDAEALRTILDGHTTGIVAKDTKILLGHPAERPVDLIDRLGRAFGDDPAVREAYLMLAQRGDQGQQSWMVGVASTGSWPAVQAHVRAATQGFTFDRALDLVNLAETSLAPTLRTGIPILTPPPPPKKRGLFGFLKG